MFNWLKNLIYDVVIIGLGAVGAIGLSVFIPQLFSGEEELWLSLLMILLSVICLGFPFLVVWERLRTKKLIRWLAEHAEELNEGVKGPDGVVYSLDTVLVSYQANLSLIVVTFGIESGFYSHGSNHRIPMTLYTLFALVFGWWTYEWQVWIENAVAILSNLSNANETTVGELFASAAEK